MVLAVKELDGKSLICCLCRQVQLVQRTCMNETLYHWTFNFHKVVRQQNLDAVEDFILLYSAVYLRISWWKNYWNRSTFAKVIVKITVARFYGPPCSHSRSVCWCQSVWSWMTSHWASKAHAWCCVSGNMARSGSSGSCKVINFGT